MLRSIVLSYFIAWIMTMTHRAGDPSSGSQFTSEAEALFLLLDPLGLDLQTSLDDSPEQGCTPEQVKDTRETPKETINSG
jgi:hypothetical protein